MRPILFVAVIATLVSCNSSSGDKDPNHAMDDTARMRDPLPQTLLFNRVLLMEKELPSAIMVKGKFIGASKWIDSLGENFLVLSSEGPDDDKGENGEEDGQTTTLYASQYIFDGDKYPQKWGSSNAVKNCPFDITAEFIPGALSVTDIDKDGIAEIKIQLATACRSDVSPATMQLVMIENGKSYKLNGNRWLKYDPDFRFTVTEKDVNLENLPPLKDETETMLRTFGRYETEKEFNAAPAGFLDYARKEWLKYVMERVEE